MKVLVECKVIKQDEIKQFSYFCFIIFVQYGRQNELLLMIKFSNTN